MKNIRNVKVSRNCKNNSRASTAVNEFHQRITQELIPPQSRHLPRRRIKLIKEYYRHYEWGC